MSSWLEYCAEGLQQTLERVWQRIQQLSASRSRAQVVLRPKQEQLLQMLRARGGLSPREIWDGLRISKQGAMDLIRPLVKAKTRQAGGHAEKRALRPAMTAHACTDAPLRIDRRRCAIIGRRACWP